MENIERKKLGQVVYDKTSAMLLDYLKVKGKIVFLQIFGQSQVVRRISRKIQVSSTKGKNSEVQFFFNAETGESTYGVFDVGSSGFFCKDVDLNIYQNHSAFLLAKTADMENMNSIFFYREKNDFEAFKEWIFQLPIPIPKEDDFLFVLKQILTEFNLISFYSSFYKQVSAIYAEEKLFNNKFACLRNCIEQILKN